MPWIVFLCISARNGLIKVARRREHVLSVFLIDKTH